MRKIRRSCKDREEEEKRKEEGVIKEKIAKLERTIAQEALNPGQGVQDQEGFIEEQSRKG